MELRGQMNLPPQGGIVATTAYDARLISGREIALEDVISQDSGISGLRRVQEHPQKEQRCLKK